MLTLINEKYTLRHNYDKCKFLFVSYQLVNHSSSHRTTKYYKQITITNSIEYDENNSLVNCGLFTLLDELTKQNLPLRKRIFRLKLDKMLETCDLIFIFSLSHFEAKLSKFIAWCVEGPGTNI